MKNKLFLFFTTIILSLGFSAIPQPVRAMMVLELNLEQLTALSEKVFVGRCVSVVPSRDSEGRPIQTVTYSVSEMLKGSASRQVVFKQLGEVSDPLATLHPEATADLFRDLPKYVVGEESVVFLSEEGVLGLTAPVGLQQGKLSVQNSESGKVVVNSRMNQGLFIGFQQSPTLQSLQLTNSEKQMVQSRSGSVGYDSFVSLVKKIVKAQP